MTYDPDDFSEEALLQAELKSVYAQLDHLAAVAQALYVGTCMIVQALDEGTCQGERGKATGERSDFALSTFPFALSPVQRGHLHLALRQARRALHMAERAPLLSEGESGKAQGESPNFPFSTLPFALSTEEMSDV